MAGVRLGHVTTSSRAAVPWQQLFTRKERSSGQLAVSTTGSLQEHLPAAKLEAGTEPMKKFAKIFDT